MSTEADRIIDSHIHFIDPGAFHYDWLDAVPAINQVALPRDVDTGGYRVDGFVVVEADCHPAEALAEVVWVAELAQNDHRIAGIVAHVDLERASVRHDALEELAGTPTAVGVRRLLQDEPADFVAAPDFHEGMSVLAETGLPFDVCVRHWQLSTINSLAAGFPHVTLVLDHVGKPDIRSGLTDPWWDDITALAKRPNVFCKLSGLTTEADHDAWTNPQIVPYLTHAIDEFGPRRCMFGSDWPVSTLATTYARWLELVLDVISDLDAGERSRVLSATASDVYRLRRE